MNILLAGAEPLSSADRGLAYGDGLFETLRLQAGRTLLRRQHIARLAGDAAKLGIEVTAAALNAALGRAMDHFGPAFNGNCILKMTLTRGVGGRGYQPPESPEPTLLLSAFPLPPDPPAGGVVVGRARFPLVVNPELAGIKSLNRLDQVMASREFSGSEWELVMANTAGELVEGTRTNLMVRMAGEWITPPIGSLAVAGVMRQFCIGRLRDRGELVRERALPDDCFRLPEFMGLCLLNSVFGVVNVRRFDGLDLPVDTTLATICDPVETLE